MQCDDNFNDTIEKENTHTNTSDLPLVLFAASSSYALNENETVHEINIVLSKASVDTISVTISDLLIGSANLGTDYNYTGWSSPEVITFDPGETLKTISITPVQDTIDEGTGETIDFALSSPVNALLGASSHVITITDDDGWVKLGETATSRAGAAAAVYGDWLYIYGGEDYSGVFDDFWRYNLATGAYETLTSIGARAYATLVELNGELYLFGGIDDTGTLHDDKIMYYYSSGSWKSFNNSDTNGSWPDVRYYHVAVPVYNSSGPVESIYFQGGKDAAEKNLDGELFEIDFTATPKYDWNTFTITSSFVRSEHSAVYYNENIYFFGGYNSGTYYNDLWKFDISSSAFTLLVSTGITIIPVRSGVQMIEQNGNLYVYGGQNGTACFDDLWSYSIGSNVWTKISTASFKRCFYSAIKYNNSLIIFGGYYLNTSGQRVYNSEVWQYNLE